MQFSEHFDQFEFEKDEPIPVDCLPAFEFLCQNILEPIRAFVGRPVVIMSGYRSPLANAAAHGVKDSEHIATPKKCAVDFWFNTAFGMRMSYRLAFDWIRNNPSLPFHQVILEHGAAGQSIIHISYNADTLPVREALEGATHNTSLYTSWDCVAYKLPESLGQENV
jgi:hypothetical protein